MSLQFASSSSRTARHKQCHPRYPSYLEWADTLVSNPLYTSSWFRRPDQRPFETQLYRFAAGHEFAERTSFAEFACCPGVC